MFADQFSAYLQTVNKAATQTAYRRVLEQFQAWYVGSYGREPDAVQLTAEEAREWRVHLTAVVITYLDILYKNLEDELAPAANAAALVRPLFGIQVLFNNSNIRVRVDSTKLAVCRARDMSH